MSMRLAVFIPMTLALALALTGCGWLSGLKKDSDPGAFEITDISVDPSDGSLVMSWSGYPDAQMYRVWISRTADCKNSLAQVAVPRTSHRFGRIGPGTYHGCVAAVPQFEYVTGDTCIAEYADVDGKGYAASNQGQSVTLEPARSGTWSKITTDWVADRIVSNQGALIVKSGNRLLIMDFQGKPIHEARTLSSLEFAGFSSYIWSQGTLFGFIDAYPRTQLHQWDEASKVWKLVLDFPDLRLTAHHLVAPDSLVFVLKDEKMGVLQWKSWNPLQPALVNDLGVVAYEPIGGWAFGNVASLYHDNSFIIADNRGLFQLTPKEIVTLALQPDYDFVPTRIYHFPGAQHEFMILTQDRLLRAAATGLVCSPRIKSFSNWSSWNSVSRKLTRLMTYSTEGFVQALPEGPVGFNWMLGGSFLELHGTPVLEFAAPPFPNARLLEGPQLPGGQLLFASDKDLWMFALDLRN